ncbi:GFA family protein [Sphingomonas bacterium]|uniref:GFA family protein n=1 Tax=Sphingomonas bacterium TaxID=1895847 RepID=UPI003F68A0B9
MTAMTGGCQCGRVRYIAEIASDDAYLCHCKMCRRATGGASIAFVNVPSGGLRWYTEPDWYRSSPIAHRPFCSTCGTPLGFAFLEGGENIDITLGSFDSPERFRPKHNYASESILPAWLDCGHLPTIRTEDNPNVVKRWKEAVGHLPR